ncbi:hypothetical protein WUBG_02383 [Wuchereria bancrofti]|uniref:Uncharacterized protein n=1 Tax=Wuchereria bancrofti TaxID=6293 RepID=J9BHA6_WUCBA|nr:hypothetical protein WUBG_02383 [Wuchereria bancrofti]
MWKQFFIPNGKQFFENEWKSKYVEFCKSDWNIPIAILAYKRLPQTLIISPFFPVNNLERVSHISPIVSATNSPHKAISVNLVYSAGPLADLKNSSKDQIGAKGEIICGKFIFKKGIHLWKIFEIVVKAHALLKGALLIAELVFKKINSADHAHADIRLLPLVLKLH